MTLTKRVLIPISTLVVCPDRFIFSYDGKKVSYKEEYDNLPEGMVDRTTNLASQFAPGAKISREANTLTLEQEAIPEQAIASLLGELLLQAQVHNLICSRTALLVAEEARDNLSRPKLIAYPTPLVSIAQTTI